MRPCLVGIGGAGGNILRQFLQNVDINLIGYQLGTPLAFGDVKGLWLESASQDTQDQDYYGSLIQGRYPPYLICHENISAESKIHNYVVDTYGFDLKAQGFDRRAEYLKGLFEVFEFDAELKNDENPLSSYMWRVGIKPFTTISVGKSSETKAEKIGYKSGVGLGNPSNLSGKMMDIPWLRYEKNHNSSKLCDSILFLASLGGGTGTGFINPISSYVRIEEKQPIFPIFALGVLTEKGIDQRKTKEGQRDLGAVIAMYDLLTKKSGQGIDGLILIDNQILMERFDGNYSAIDACIYDAIKPLLDQRNYPGDKLQDDSQAIRRVIWEVTESNNAGDNGNQRSEYIASANLLPAILVPCYNFQPDSKGNVKDLVQKVLGEKRNLDQLGKDGRLFPCDPAKADRALVITRGFFKSKEIVDAVSERTNLLERDIMVYRKLGDSKTEDMLILLRNPYGGAPGGHKNPGTLERRLHNIISESIEYIENNEMNILGYQSYTDKTKDELRTYFYGKDGLRDELNRCLERIETGQKPIFTRPLKIFGDGAMMQSGNGSRSEQKTACENLNDLKDQLIQLLDDTIYRNKIKELLKE